MTEQGRASQPIRVGDTVTFTQSFIDRRSRLNGDTALASGKVTALHRIAQGIVMADIDWRMPGLSKRLDVKNLVRVGS